MGGSRATFVAAVVAAIVMWLVAPQANAFEGNASIELSKTVGAARLAPALGITFGVSPDRGIPGDRLTYTATVTNGGPAKPERKFEADDLEVPSFLRRK